MVRETLLGFPSHTLPYRYRKYTALSTVSQPPGKAQRLFFYITPLRLHRLPKLQLPVAIFVPEYHTPALRRIKNLDAHIYCVRFMLFHSCQPE